MAPTMMPRMDRFLSILFLGEFRNVIKEMVIPKGGRKTEVTRPKITSVIDGLAGTDLAGIQQLYNFSGSWRAGWLLPQRALNVL